MPVWSRAVRNSHKEDREEFPLVLAFPDCLNAKHLGCLPDMPLSFHGMGQNITNANLFIGCSLCCCVPRGNTAPPPSPAQPPRSAWHWSPWLDYIYQSMLHPLHVPNVLQSSINTSAPIASTAYSDMCLSFGTCVCVCTCLCALCINRDLRLCLSARVLLCGGGGGVI